MPWLALLVAGLLEVVWASALERASEPLWFGITLVTLLASVGLLAVAVRTVPLGVGYAVWVGIGVLGTTAVSVWRGDRLSLAQGVFLALIGIGIVGMKLAAPASPASD